MMGGKPSHSGTSPSWGLPQKDLPPLKLFRVREISPPRVVLGDNLDGVAELFDGLDYGWGYDGISALFDGLAYNKMSHFQRNVHKVMKVFRKLCSLIVKPDTLSLGLVNIGDTTMVTVDIFYTTQNTIW